MLSNTCLNIHFNVEWLSCTLHEALEIRTLFVTQYERYDKKPLRVFM